MGVECFQSWRFVGRHFQLYDTSPGYWTFDELQKRKKKETKNEPQKKRDKNKAKHDNTVIIIIMMTIIPISWGGIAVRDALPTLRYLPRILNWPCAWTCWNCTISYKFSVSIKKVGEGGTGGASDIVKAKSFGEDPSATGGLVSNLSHPLVNKTKQHHVHSPPA